MIEAKELRIGNLINYEQTTHLITCINIDYTVSVWVDKKGKEHLYTHQSNELKPIPLTEEWLIKFGFKSDPYQDRYILVTNNGEFIIHYNKTKGYLELWLDLSLRTVDLKTVHQLQNLLHALTGEELTI